MSMATDAMEREIEDDAYDRGFEDGVKFREATLEERNSVDAYIKSISVDVEEEIRADERAKFAHELKERFNVEFPSNYPSTKPFFTLENARMIVDEVAEEQSIKQQ